MSSPLAGTRSIERVPSPAPSQRDKDVEKGEDAAKGSEVLIGPPAAPGAARTGEGLQRQMNSRHSAYCLLLELSGLCEADPRIPSLQLPWYAASSCGFRRVNSRLLTLAVRPADQSRRRYRNRLVSRYRECVGDRRPCEYASIEGGLCVFFSVLTHVVASSDSWVSSSATL